MHLPMGRVAMLLLFLTGGLLVGREMAGPELDGEGLFAPREVRTGPDETATVTMEDGSILRLAPSSRVLVIPDPSRRVVQLDGRAFLAVARDEDRPFLVRSGAGEARVLGTRFEVDVSDGELRLVVVEGRVALTGSSGGEVELASGQVSRMREGEEPWVVEVEDVWSLLAWMGRFQAFESTPLHAVAEEFNRRFGLQFVFEDSELRDETVTVWFGEEPLEEAVFLLCRLVSADCSMEDSEVRFSRRR